MPEPGHSSNHMSGGAPRITVAIPTYGREAVLVGTMQYLLAIKSPAFELIVVDQTPVHEPETVAALNSWSQAGQIVVIQQQHPSITKAMNTALLAAKGEVVLFLDDDIRPDERLIEAHALAQLSHPGAIIAGRVLQPWHKDKEIPELPFEFASRRSQSVSEFMGGNFSVSRLKAIEIGGFDENFVRVAYRFEADFAARWISSGGTIWFESAALIHHLKVATGGTRSFGEHLTTIRPDHAVGYYYHALKSFGMPRAGRALAKRFLTAVATRHHVRRPWYIPVTLVAEIRGLVWAISLARRGPAYLNSKRNDGCLP